MDYFGGQRLWKRGMQKPFKNVHSHAMGTLGRKEINTNDYKNQPNVIRQVAHVVCMKGDLV